MSDSHWHRAQDVFLTALEQPAEARDAFVADECRDDAQLADAVAALLSGHEADGPVDQLADETGALGAFRGRWRDAAPRDPNPGDQIGPFEIVSTLGRGGMATVYRARRATDDFDQEVALKLVGRHDSSKEATLRFAFERQIAARLDHPNIAKLIDGGVADDGRPYFALELIDGLPIDRYCDQRRLSVAERVTLIRDVAHAVHYAHRNLLVHRDLKPSNILVEPDGRVRLLDFGIAKPLDPEAVDSARTRTGALLLTPRYASPEQFRGGAITTASDQYQLGLLLFELVTGRCHHLLDGEDLGSLSERITSLETPRPSRLLATGGGLAADDLAAIARARGASIRELTRQVHGDLDTIILKTLEKDPDRRYASAEALADDLERYLRDEPVEARPSSVAYRWRKLARRNRLAFTAAGLGLVALLVGAFVAGWQAIRATAAERVALEQAATAEEVSTFLIDLFEVSDPEVARGDDVTARALLERGRARVEQKLAEQPRIQVRLMDTIAIIHRKLGLYDDALPLATQALETRRRLDGPGAPSVALGTRALGRLHADRGDDESAEPLLVEAEERLRVAGDEHVADHVETLLDLGYLHHRRGDLATASDHFERAAAQLTGRTAAALVQADVLEGQGLVAFSRGEYPAAESLQRQVLEVRESALANDHPDLARALSSLANTLGWQGLDSEAAPLHERAVAVLEKAYGAEHRRVGESLNRLASLYGRMGRLDDAEAAFQRVAAIQEAVFGPGHARTLGVALNLGRIAHLGGDFAGAEQRFRGAAAHAEASLGAGHPLFGFAHTELGGLYRDIQRYPEARRHYTRGLSVLESALGPEHGRLAEALGGLAFLDAEAGRFDQAEARYRRALTIQEAAYGGDKPPLASTLNGLGSLARRRGDFAAARAWHRRAHDAWANAYDADHPAAGKCLALIGLVDLDAGDLETASDHFERALAIAEAAHGPDHLETAEPHAGLARVAAARGDDDRADALWAQSLAVLHATYGEDHPRVAAARGQRAAGR